ncbi:hypothetical protein AUS46_20260, partial [Escherichia coli]
MVPVGALIIRTDTPFRDEVGFLRQPAVTVIPVKIVRVTGDTVIRPHAEGAVRVQLRVGQAVTCRVCGRRDADIQLCCCGVNVGGSAGGAGAGAPRLARAAGAAGFGVVGPG